MRRASLLLLLAFLIPSAALAQEIKIGDRGVVTNPFFVLVESGATVNNANRVFKPHVDRCEVQKDGDIHIGRRLFDKPDTFMIHYDIKAAKKQQGEACPQTMFFATLAELRAQPIKWKVRY